jgi:hypothetical protein
MKLEALQERTIKSLKAKSEKKKRRMKEKFEREETRKKLKQGKNYIPPAEMPNFEDDFETKMEAVHAEHSKQRRVQLTRISSMSTSGGFKRAKSQPVESGILANRRAFTRSITQRHREAAEEMRRKRGDVITTFDTFCMSMIMVFYLLTPTLTGAALDLFNCETIGNEQRLAADLQVKCWEGYHLYVILGLGVPSASINIFLFPVLLFSYLKYQDTKGKLNAENAGGKKTAYRFGLYYTGYTSKRWWYELTVIYRKIVMGMLVTFGSLLETQQMHIALCFIVVFLFLNLHLRPFTYKAEGLDKIDGLLLHRLEYMSILMMFIMIWSGVLFNLVPDCSAGADSVEIVWCNVLMGAVIAANLAYIMYGSLRCVKAFAERHKDRVERHVRNLGNVAKRIKQKRKKMKSIDAGSMKKSADSGKAAYSSDEVDSEDDTDELYNMDNLYNLDYHEADDEDQFDEEGNPLPVVHSNPLAQMALGEMRQNTVKGITTSLRAAAIFRRTLHKTRNSRKDGAQSPATRNPASGGRIKRKSSVKGVVSTLLAIRKFKNSVRKHGAESQAADDRESTSGGAAAREGTFWISNPAAKKTGQIKKRRNRKAFKSKTSNSKIKRKHFSLSRSVVDEIKVENNSESNGSVQDADVRVGVTSAYQRAKLSGVVLNRELFAESESGRIYAIDTIDGVDQPAHWISDESIHLDVTSGRVYSYDEESGVTEWLDDFDVRLDDRRV